MDDVALDRPRIGFRLGFFSVASGVCLAGAAIAHAFGSNGWALFDLAVATLNALNAELLIDD